MKEIRKAIPFLLLIVVLFIASAISHANDDTFIQFRSIDDPNITADATVCQNSPLYYYLGEPNVLLGASLWSIESRASDGMVMNDDSRGIGLAHACVWVSSLVPGTDVPFYIEFGIGEQTYPADGVCRVITDTIPVSGLILVGCNLKIFETNGTSELKGIATSNSVFNPLGLTGYRTGSIWTLHLY